MSSEEVTHYVILTYIGTKSLGVVYVPAFDKVAARLEAVSQTRKQMLIPMDVHIGTEVLYTADNKPDALTFQNLLHDKMQHEMAKDNLKKKASNN